MAQKIVLENKEIFKSKLHEIVDNTGRELEQRKKKTNLSVLESLLTSAESPRGFAKALGSADRDTKIIAEIKRKSPSKGLFRQDFDPMARGLSYQENGAACLSILTDYKYFGGSLDLYSSIRASINIPCLVKDFIIDEYQLYEARAAGADAYLLIARILELDQMSRLLEVGNKLGMDCLYEVNDEQQVDIALDLGVDLIGINNRDLMTFKTDLAVTERLAKLIPDDKVIVALSGVKDRQDIERLKKAGAAAYLIGETLSRSDDPKSTMRNLMGAE